MASAAEMPSEQPDPESIDMVDTTSDAKGDTAGEKVGITEDTIRKAMEEFGVTDDEAITGLHEEDFGRASKG